MPVYTSMPSKHQWKVDLGQSYGIFGHTASTGAPMQRIGRLIDEYDGLAKANVGRVANAEVESTKLVILFQIYRHSRYVVKNAHNKAKIGAELNAKKLGAVQGICAFVTAQLRAVMGATEETFAAELIRFFGKQVDPHGQHEDEAALRNEMIQYYTTDVARAPFKLSFRNGLAHKHPIDKGIRSAGVVNYDTDAAGDNLENGGSLFVLDPRGRIYVSGREGERSLKHSSFLGGGATLCAGTMRVANGRVAWVSARSGHYRPTVTQMVNLLERLRSYQVDLLNVMVCRENYTARFQGTPWRNFEACKAMDLMVRRAWPTGVEPQAMRVG
jgi:hypothetical protein